MPNPKPTEISLSSELGPSGQLLPVHELDEEPIPDEILQAIRLCIPQDDFRPTKKLFDGV
jgi:hypothetical protein